MKLSLSRPVIIDLNDGPCEICAGHSQGTCDGCSEKLDPRDPAMGQNGYQSVKPSHFHLKSVLGTHGKEARHAELCYACHRKDRYEQYGEGYGEQAA